MPSPLKEKPPELPESTLKTLPGDIFAVCQQIPGVRYLGVVKLFGLRKYDREWLRSDIPELEVNPCPLGLVCSWEDEDPELRSRHLIEFID